MSDSPAQNTIQRCEGGTATERIEAYREDMQRTDTPGNMGRALDAYNRLVAESERLGRSLSALDPYLEDEVERFFSRVIYGADGHAYWPRRGNFDLGGSSTHPRRWWWGHVNGALASKTIALTSLCGEPNCIRPEHCGIASRERARLFSDQQMIGSIQVVAMRLGYVPRGQEWDKAGYRPSVGVYAQRFGSFQRAVRAAGLEMRTVKRANRFTREDCVNAITFSRHNLNRWPTHSDFLRLRDELAKRDLPIEPKTILRHFKAKTWAEAMERA